MEHYILLGGGGFALEMYAYLLEDGYNIKGYYAKEESGSLKGRLHWLGDPDTLKEEEIDKEARYFIAVRLLKYRLEMIEFIEKNGLRVEKFIHKEAFISPAVQIGKGAVIFPRAMLTGNACVGDYFFIDCLSIISHGDEIGDNVVIGPSVTICGDCIVGNNCTFGVNSAVLPGTRIGDNSEIAICTFPGRRVKEGSNIISPPGKNFGHGLNKNFK